MPMIDTLAANLQRVFAVDSTSAAYPSRVPTVTQPTPANNPGLITLNGSPTDGPAPNQLLFFPYGRGEATDTFNLQILAWKQLPISGLVTLWWPFVLYEIACTLGSTSGVNGTGVAALDLVCNDIDLVTGNLGVDIEVTVPGGELAAYCLFDAKGNNLLEVIVNLETSATAANAIFSRL